MTNNLGEISSLVNISPTNFEVSYTFELSNSSSSAVCETSSSPTLKLAKIEEVVHQALNFDLESDPSTEVINGSTSGPDQGVLV